MITPIRGRKRTEDFEKFEGFTLIRNDNPDKGTETMHRKLYNVGYLDRLEMITPIRGRKLIALDKETAARELD